MPVNRSMGSKSTVDSDHKLVESRAELDNPRACGLNVHAERKPRGIVEQQDDAVEFTFTRASRQRQPDGMKQIAATKIETFFKRRDHLFEAVRSERRGIEQQQSEMTDHVARTLTSDDR